MVRRFRLSVGAVGLLLAAMAWQIPASAQGKPKPKPVKVVKAATPKPKKAGKAKAEPETAKEDALPPAEPASKAPTESEAKPRAAGTSQPEAPSKASVKEKEGPEGVKTYQFGAIEVEGRQKSPQLIYFLRRVRAEFDAGALGHRSFLGELKDTRNDTAFR